MKIKKPNGVAKTVIPTRIHVMAIDPAKVWPGFPRALRLAEGDGMKLGTYDGEKFTGVPVTLAQVISWLEAVDLVTENKAGSATALEVLRWVAARGDVEIEVPVLPGIERIAKRAGLPYAKVASHLITDSLIRRSLKAKSSK